MCTWFSWAIQPNGDPSAEFIAWLTALSIPVGTVIWRPVSTVPTGYLQANGQTVSRTTYTSLFAVIGTAYGAGDGSSTFKVPDISGRMLIGTGASGPTGTTRNTGDVGGAETVVQTVSQMPAHVHGIPPGVMSFGLSSGQKGDSTGNAFGYTDPPDTESAGGGSAMNVMNPTMAGLFLIKF